MNLRAAIYGLIIVGALVAADRASHATYGKTVGAVALALILYWLAHSYAEFTSRRLAQRQPLGVRNLKQAALHELPMLSGAALPLLAILIAWMVHASLSNAISAALWTAAGGIVAVEVIAGIRAKLSGRELLIQSAVGGGLGLLVIAVHIVLY